MGNNLRAALVMGAVVGIMSLGVASAQQFTTSTCNEGAANPPACNPANPTSDRAEGWMGQKRSEVMARNGIVTTSQPLAAQAGLSILQKGGNAVDAAVATAAALGLMEPQNVGMGGDLFAIIYTAKDHKFHLLNASGKAPTGQTLQFMNDHGYKASAANNGPGSGMPRHGILTATVPGTVWGWQEVLEKYGTMSFKQVLQPALDYATNGFALSERIGHEWVLPTAVNADPANPDHCCTAQDPDSIATWYIGGKRLHPGDIYRSPDMAKTFKLLQTQGRDAFYKGEIAKAIVAKAHKLGGTMTLDDLANYKGEWVEPITSDYHGFTLLELPPPSQGWAANEMLNILQACVGVVYPGQSLASMGPTDVRYWHMLVEAKKLAYADLNTYNADPDFTPGLGARVKTMLSSAHAKSLCAKIDPAKASQIGAGKPGGEGDTIVLSAADRWGNMVSWVNSNFSTFGSGVTVPGYGFLLHNRGALFTLDPKSPNVIAPHKRPYNTLAASFVLPGGRTDGQVMAMQLMGGDMQSQGHAQMVVNLVDLGANPQASTDMARFHHDQTSNKLQMESPLYKLVGPQLKAMGHDVASTSGQPMGGYQSILFTPIPGTAPPDVKDTQSPVNGYYRGASDSRKDGAPSGW